MEFTGGGGTTAEYLTRLDTPHPPITHRPGVLLCNGIGQITILKQQEQRISAEPAEHPWHLLGQAAP